MIEQGVEAIFAVTNFWEHMFMGSTALEARDKEVEQGTYVTFFLQQQLSPKDRETAT